LVQEQAHEDANIIFGASIDEALGENVKVTVIATGFDTMERMQSMHEAARVSAQVPATIPSMQMPRHSAHPGQVYAPPPASMQHRAPEMAPAYSTRRVA